MEEVIERDGMFVFTTTHQIFFNTAKPIPIHDVIQSLQGLEGLLKTLPKVLSAVTGSEIESGEYHILRIESGSLLEEIVVQLLFKDRAGLDAFVAKIGANKPVKSLVITAALAAAAGYGLHLATSSKPSANITATNNVIINIGAGEVGLTPEAFTAVVKSAIQDRKDVAVNALKFISPAKSDPKSSISLAPEGALEGQTLVISPAAIADSPAKFELEPNERVEEYQSAKLTIRATNLDSKKTGWAGKLGDRPDRLRIELDPSVDEADVFGRSELTVDAALVFTQRANSRELKANRIYIRKVIKDRPAKK